MYIIDFGISKRFDYNGTHIDETKIHKLIGSPNFVSLNVHKGIEPSRRDDLESCVYIIMNMLLGKLEWFDKQDLNEMALLKYQVTSVIEIPSFIKIMLYYVRGLEFTATPDYDYIILLMVKVFNEHNYQNDGQYEWNK